MSFGIAEEGLIAADWIVAKVTGISEVAQIARSETLLRAFLMFQWLRQTRRVIEQAARSAEGGSDTAAIIRSVDSGMEMFGPLIETRVSHDVEDIYKLSRRAAHKKAIGAYEGSLQYDMPIELPVEKARRKRPKAPTLAIEPAFDVVDRAAIKALQRSQTFWIGDFYNRNLSTAIRRTISEVMIVNGQHRRVAGPALERALTDRFNTIELPSGWRGSSRAYWESTAANVATTARAQGAVRSFKQTNVEYYEIVNPLDERTCEVCSHMHEKVFRTDDGINLGNRMLGSKTIDDMKATKPWFGAAALRSISPLGGRGTRSDAMSLGAVGMALPPYHFRCRCTIDITDRPPGWDDQDVEE